MDSLLHDRVTEVVPRIREEAARTEAERRIPTEVLAALMDAGLFALDPVDDLRLQATERLDVVRLVAGACGSTGWMTANAAAAPWLLAAFASSVRERVRGEPGVDPLVAFSLEPAGRVDERDGELWLSGTWPGVSGATYANWLVLSARRSSSDGPGPVGLVVVPASDCTLTASVDSIGLTAAGAQDVAVSDVALPTDAWTAPEDGSHGPLTPVGALAAMALVGAAQGALEEHLQQVRRRVDITHGGEDVSAAGLSPARIGRAASQLDAAVHALVARIPDPDGLPQEPLEQQRFAVERAVEGAELVFSSVRGHALDNGDPVARLWRDVQVGAHHTRALLSWLRTLGS